MVSPIAFRNALTIEFHSTLVTGGSTIENLFNATVQFCITNKILCPGLSTSCFRDFAITQHTSNLAVHKSSNAKRSLQAFGPTRSDKPGKSGPVTAKGRDQTLPKQNQKNLSEVLILLTIQNFIWQEIVLLWV